MVVMSLTTIYRSTMLLYCSELDVGGAAFKFFEDDFWKENGISKVGLFYIGHIKEKKVLVKRFDSFPIQSSALIDLF